MSMSSMNNGTHWGRASQPSPDVSEHFSKEGSQARQEPSLPLGMRNQKYIKLGSCSPVAN